MRLHGAHWRGKPSEAELEQHVQYEEQEKENQQRNLDVKRLMMARLSEVLHVDWGTDERTDVDYVTQWEQRLHEFERSTKRRQRDDSITIRVGFDDSFDFL